MDKLELLNKANRIIIENDKEKAIEIICKNIYDTENIDIVSILVDAFQLYGYTQSIKEFDDMFFNSSFDLKYHSYDGKIIEHLNQGQLSLLNIIRQEEKLLISAPTSFGKTTLIMEYILRNIDVFNNIIFILPTKSLIEELYIKFIKLNKNLCSEQKYYITVNIFKIIGRKIRILTPEKFLNYYEYNSLKDIDLIVMDEVYKIENDGRDRNETVVDNRAYKFRKVLEIISESNKKVILLSPYTYNKDTSMEEYISKYKIIDVNRRDKYVYHVYKNLSKAIDFGSEFQCDKPLSKDYDTIYKKVRLILEKIRDKRNIVYISYLSKGLQIIKELKKHDICFLDLSVKEDVKDRYEKFIKHLEETYNIDDIEWCVITALKMGIGIYTGAMPRYIKKEIVQLYEDKIINCMFVTTAFVEGVNTSAENILITSGCTASSIKLNDLSLLNISGRAGRFGKNYIGNIYFIDNEVYERVIKVRDIGVEFHNPNYQENTTEKIRNDFQIEMMEDKYLTAEEKNRKEEIINEIVNSGENVEKINSISISAPNEWKIKLLNYFKNCENIEKYKEDINNIISEESDNFLLAVESIFNTIIEAGINIERSYSDPKVFDKEGNFIWGEMYKSHINGNIKGIVIYNKNNILKNASKLSRDFLKQSWMWNYFDEDGTFNYDKLYEETFHFISNIIEYKIPYYIYLFINMYIHFISTRKNGNPIEEQLDIERILDTVENLGINKEDLQYYEYGFSKDFIEKINKVDFEIILENIDFIDEFDSYEKIMFKEYLTLFNEE